MVHCKNFLDFWNANKNDVKRIMGSICRDQMFFSPDEMFSMLWIRLERSNFLLEFDPAAGSKLSTYFYGRVWGYAKHIIAQHINENSYVRSVDPSKRIYFEQIFSKEFNGYEHVEDLEAFVDLGNDPGFDLNLEAKEIVSQLRKHLNSTEKKILKMIYSDGISVTNCMKTLKCSRRFINTTCSRIKHIAYTLITETVEVMPSYDNHG